MGEPLVAEAARRALEEDAAQHDVTTMLLGPAADGTAAGDFVAEAACVVAGWPAVRETFAQLDPRVTLSVRREDGSRVAAGDRIATASGPARALLAGERVALNFLQRLSGVATLTWQAVEAIADTGATVTDTRKTTPGLRALEKYAVRVGGGENHRLDLAGAVLWKDNHWTLLGRAGRRLVEVLAGAPLGLQVTVEVETVAQLEEALAAGARRLLLDNASPERIAEWARRAGPDVTIEVSGGIRPDTARAYAEAGARYISIGALTHSAPAIPIRFDLAFDA